jgi:hypothetical protein
MSPDQLNAMVGKYYEFLDTQAAQQYELDTEAAAQANAELRQEWGANFGVEVKHLKTFMAKTFGEQMGNDIGMARLPDGRVLGNIPQYVKMMAEIARTMSPFGTLVPAGSADAVKAGEARIAEIEKKMRDDPDGYWKDPSLQGELMQLYEARLRHNNQSEAA